MHAQGEVRGRAHIPPEEGPTFVSEIHRFVKACLPLGLKKVRITGGEPLLRPGLEELVSMLSETGVETALTTNASLLSRHAEVLAASGLDRVTVSLDLSLIHI